MNIRTFFFFLLNEKKKFTSTLAFQTCPLETTVSSRTDCSHLALSEGRAGKALEPFNTITLFLSDISRTASIKMTALLDVVPCSLFEVD
jgi:hypothetical protein